MDNVNWEYIGALVDQLYSSTDKLEEIFPGRKFTLDGHLVGSVGEVAAAYMFDLELNPASTLGHDAISSSGKKVEVKLTQGERIGIRHEPEHLIVLRRPKGQKLSVVYNGPGSLAWEAAGKLQRNGQRPISVARLMRLNASIGPNDRIEIQRKPPF